MIKLTAAVSRQIESPAALVESHRWLKDDAAELGIAEPQELREESGRYAFLFTDPGRELLGNRWAKLVERT